MIPGVGDGQVNQEPTSARVGPGRAALRSLLRLLTISVLVCAGAYVLYLYHQVMQGPAETKRGPTSKEPTLDSLAHIPPGPWQMGGLMWNLRSNERPKAEALRWLDAAVPAAASADEVPDPLEGILLDLVRGKANIQELPLGMRVYALSEEPIHLRAFVQRKEQSERLLAIRAAFPDKEQWRCLEARPNAPLAVKTDSGSGLLPWPVGATRLAVRRDEHGVAMGELVQLPGTLEAFLPRLENAGWTITGQGTRTCSGPAGQTVALWVADTTSKETFAHTVLAVRLKEQP